MLCHICAKDLKMRFAKVTDAQTGERFSILACAECGLAQTSPVPNDLNFYYANYHGGGDTAQPPIFALAAAFDGWNKASPIKICRVKFWTLAAAKELFCSKQNGAAGERSASR